MCALFREKRQAFHHRFVLDRPSDPGLVDRLPLDAGRKTLPPVRILGDVARVEHRFLSELYNGQ
jgi:hypothetical protein